MSLVRIQSLSVQSWLLLCCSEVRYYMLLSLKYEPGMVAPSEVSVWYADSCGLDPHVQQFILSWRFGHEKIYSHSLPSADSRRAVISYW